jgi:hypothetical protein
MGIVRAREVGDEGLLVAISGWSFDNSNLLLTGENRGLDELNKLVDLNEQWYSDL